MVVTPVARDRAIIIGRHGGPPFLDSEIARLNHLAALVKYGRRADHPGVPVPSARASWGWPELVALLTSFGFGVLSAVVPIANGEAYVIASQVTAVAGAAADRRRGRDRPDVRQAAPLPRHPPGPGLLVRPASARSRRPIARSVPSGARFRLRSSPRCWTWSAQNRWGLPIVLLAAVIGSHPSTP